MINVSKISETETLAIGKKVGGGGGRGELERTNRGVYGYTKRNNNMYGRVDLVPAQEYSPSDNFVEERLTTTQVDAPRASSFGASCDMLCFLEVREVRPPTRSTGEARRSAVARIKTESQQTFVP